MTTEPTEDEAARREALHVKRVEAGRKGGLTTKARYGTAYFQRVGRLGGKLGGETTRDRYGLDHYRRIGKLGGSR
jgi:uncharacterized protein